MWDRFVNGLIDRQLNNYHKTDNNIRILDAGCGLGIFGITTRLRHYEKNLYIEGCDIHEPYLEITKKYNIYDKVQTDDVAKMMLYTDKSFDLAIGIGVLTHLEKSEGIFFKSQLERIANHVILTGAQHHIHNHDSLQNNPLIKPLEHKSTWSHKDFKGYNMRGFHRKGSSGGSLLDTWLYPSLYTLTAIHPGFTRLTQYLVAWK